MDPTTFAQLLLDSILQGLKTDLGIGWTVLLAHPWLILLVVGVVTLGVIARLTRRLPRARRRYR